MQTMASMLTSFEKPSLTPEQWAENNRQVREWDERQRVIAVAQRISRSRIPAGYREFGITDERIAAWVSNPGYGIIIRGAQGRMKTGNACAALCELAKGMTILFATLDDLKNDVKATFSSDETESSVISRYSSVGCLCLDDLGRSQMTDWTLPILFEVVKRRDERRKPTIVTTNYSGNALLDWMTIDGDDTTARTIASRLARYDRVVLEGPDRRWS